MIIKGKSSLGASHASVDCGIEKGIIIAKLAGIQACGSIK